MSAEPLYRTELLAPGQTDQRWSLNIDGHEVAAHPPDLGNQHAKDWAHRQLGEGLQWKPALHDHLADEALADGHRIDWLASPDRFSMTGDDR